MRDYEYIRDYSENIDEKTQELINDLLVPFAARRDNFDREFDKRFLKYARAAIKANEVWLIGVKVQYIIHRVMKHQGPIRKYMQRPEFKDLDIEDLDLLRKLTTKPWRFSYSVVTEQPAPGFYEMEDVFTGENFLLLSNAAEELTKRCEVRLWFNLIYFNGQCWQTYGPLTGFPSLDPDDIFFFATELNKKVNSDQDLMKDLEDNPVPYQLLFIHSQAPVLEHGGFEIVHAAGGFEVKEIDTALWQKHFTLKTRHEVMRFTHDDWNSSPHFARIYFDPAKSTLFIKSMTDESYSAMITMVNQLGLKLHYEPDIRLHSLMELMIGEILQKRIFLDPYSGLFSGENVETDKDDSDEVEVDEKDSEAFDNMMAILIQCAKTGKKPDLKKLAAATDLDLSNIELLYRQILKKLGK